jgi:hypothetical protein
MQQATHPQDSANPTVDPVPSGNAANSFVINLCSSTSPVALSPLDHAGLKRFTFFVSRRREDGRERFRLHMGYFATQEEAEKLLEIVREIYPGAWAGMAPGQRLRTISTPQGSTTPTTASAAKAVTPKVVAPSTAVPAVAAPKVVAVADVAPAVLPEPITAAATEGPVPALAVIATPAAASVGVVRSQASAEETLEAVRSLSDVRAAIASLDDGTGIRQSAMAVAPKAVDAGPVLSNEGAMAVLESTPAVTATVAAAAAARGAVIAQNAKDAGPSAEKTLFAVQLAWSVQPIDMTSVPQLAIFSAYSLYGAEGNREGRRWYGLRLGFFTDAVSAKQVAHYVRSEFSTVSVVPVTPRERERALAASRPEIAAVPAPAVVAVAPTVSAAAAKPVVAARPAFEFIEDKPAVDAPRSARATGAPAKRGKPRSAAQPSARARKMTLEETLEILGAGDLNVDDGRAELLNDETAANAAAPRKAATKGKSSRLGRLFDRLSERIGN